MASYITAEGLKKLNDELYQLENIERPSITRQIAEARDKGDLSENAEYDAAKEAQGMLEMRINKLQGVIANSRIINKDLIDTDTVQLLNIVTIKNVKNGAEMQYTIVSQAEADLKSKKLSIDTPIAKGLLGKKVGDIVDVKIPNGTATFEVIDISI